MGRYVKKYKEPKTIHKDDVVTYQGMSQDDLKKKYIYNPLTGEFFNKQSGQLITSTIRGRPVIAIRYGDRVSTLSMAKVALMIMDNRSVSKDEYIKFIDKDCSNLKYSNLSVMSKKTINLTQDHTNFSSEPTGHKRVFVVKGTLNSDPSKVVSKYFVVRRGPEQAVYRTKDYDHAVDIAEEWLKDNSIHRWDDTYPKHFL